MEKLNKPIRMVVCDLDGTLLYSTKKLRIETRTPYARCEIAA
ncbi:hypothetical protein [Allobaculum sp. Allo2]|nr:hypothetical protein [Allobaculum sp. Allo2]